MKVSVLIPTYNRAYILREAISSAFNQTYRDFEIVIVDDGSTDNTAELVASLQDSRVRYLRHEINRGYSAACNTAIRAAAGELLGFLDSDDRWKPEYLERQVKFLLGHPETGAVFSDLEIVNGPAIIPSLIRRAKAFPVALNAELKGQEIVIGGRPMFLCLLEDVPIKPSALVVRRELYDRAGLFNESWPSGTDWDLFLRFSRLTSFGYIDCPLAVQTWSPDATHRKYWEQDKLFLLGVFLKEKTKASNDKEALSAIRRGLSTQYSHLAFHYLYSGKHARSAVTYLQGFQQTGEIGMILRAASTLVPTAWRDFAKHLMGKTPSQVPGTGRLES